MVAFMCSENSTPSALAAAICSLEESGERGLAHEGGVDDLTGLERSGLLEHGDRAIGGDEFDADVGGFGDGDGFFVGEEIALAVHRGDAGFGIGGPCAHLVRVGLGVILHGLGRAAVGVALAQHGIHGGAEHFGITGAGFLFGIGGRVFRKIRDLVALRLKLGDGRLELRNGGGNVRQLDDVGLGLEREGAEFGEVVGRAGDFRELGEDAAGQRDVAGFHRDAGVFGEGLHDRQQRAGGKGGASSVMV